jgi:hypothetical protein
MGTHNFRVSDVFKTEGILLTIYACRNEDTIVEVPMVIKLGVSYVSDGLMALPTVEKGPYIV